MKKVNINKTSAFSLIEMSISLILITLIVVGIIGGARIVKNARISSAISEMNNYSSDMNAFYTRFEQYPGDFIMATSMLVDDDGNTINNGDNNDLIGNVDFSENESAGFFHHLHLAGIIPAIPFNGVAVANATSVVIDENYPGTKFSDDTFYYIASDNIDGKYKRQNRIVIASTIGNDVGSLIPQDAESFDNKIDDGI
jgi:type II secretory pathway pseudopilin PulG